MLLNMLAEAPVDTAKQIAELHERIAWGPVWAYELMFGLLIGVTAMVAMIYLRQQKIANNQVALAKLFEQILKR